VTPEPELASEEEATVESADIASSSPESSEDTSAQEAERSAEEEPEEAAVVVAAGEPEAPVGPAEEVEAPSKPARRRRGSAAKPAAEVKKPAKPAPVRRRRREQPAGPPPVVQAKAKYVRSSARKARLVCANIRGKTVPEARAILAHTPRAVARDWSKLLESAVANAEHNHELVGEDLYVQAIHADEGPTLKRFRPRAMGRATRIRKRTSHLTILLTPKD
jgi:ribosomal protein L22